jgi:hypothetical protein
MSAPLSPFDLSAIARPCGREMARNIPGVFGAPTQAATAAVSRPEPLAFEAVAVHR